MSVLERCPSYRQSNKGSKERQGPTLSVSLEVSVKRESTVLYVHQSGRCYSGYKYLTSLILILGQLNAFLKISLFEKNWVDEVVAGFTSEVSLTLFNSEVSRNPTKPQKWNRRGKGYLINGGC